MKLSIFKKSFFKRYAFQFAFAEPEFDTLNLDKNKKYFCHVFNHYTIYYFVSFTSIVSKNNKNFFPFEKINIGNTIYRLI